MIAGTAAEMVVLNVADGVCFTSACASSCNRCTTNLASKCDTDQCFPRMYFDATSTKTCLGENIYLYTYNYTPVYNYAYQLQLCIKLILI